MIVESILWKILYSVVNKKLKSQMTASFADDYKNFSELGQAHSSNIWETKTAFLQDLKINVIFNSETMNLKWISQYI